MGIRVVAKNHLQSLKTMFLPKITLKITIWKLQILYTVQYFLFHSHVICMSIVCTPKSHVYNLCDTRVYAHLMHMSLVWALTLSICTRMSSGCHSYVIVCHLYVTLCARILFVCHSYVLHMSYLTHMYLYVICMSLLCTHMSSVCHS